MVTVDKFFDYIAPHAPDAPDDLIQFTIQDAIVDFLIDTRIATDFYRFKVHEKINDYVLDIPSCHTIIDIREVRTGNSCEASSEWSVINRTKGVGVGGYAVDLHNNGIPAIWIDNPVADNLVEVEYVYTLGREDCNIPDFVYNQFARVIQALVLSRIYFIHGQEWSNTALGGHYLQQYEKYVKQIKQERRIGAGGRLKSKPFIGGCGRGCFGGFFKP